MNGEKKATKNKEKGTTHLRTLNQDSQNGDKTDTNLILIFLSNLSETRCELKALIAPLYFLASVQSRSRLMFPSGMNFAKGSNRALLQW